MPEIGPSSTITEARAWLRERLQEGAKCPCCTQNARTYKRTITRGAAAGLVHAYLAHGVDNLFHAPSDPALARLGGEWARLALWNLIEEAPTARDDGGRAGYWMVTPKGAGFVRDGLLVPKHLYLFDGRVMGSSLEQLTIREALGHRFDLRELLERGAA